MWSGELGDGSDGERVDFKIEDGYEKQLLVHNRGGRWRKRDSIYRVIMGSSIFVKRNLLLPFPPFQSQANEFDRL